MRSILGFFSFVLVILVIVSLNRSSGDISESEPARPDFLEEPAALLPPVPEATVRGVKSKGEFCDAVNDQFRQFGWSRIVCNPDRWQTFDYSSRGNPIFYQEFGFDQPGNNGPVNLIFCGVHGDEPPSVYLCFSLVREILFEKPGSLENFRLVVAPIVNPDGFFAGTRQNGNGIDPNRNLPTKDWQGYAHSVWAETGRDPRKNPGEDVGSEAESQLQVYLIDKYMPDKIVSVHAPFGFLDFDGPGDQKYRNLSRIENRAKFLSMNIEANSNKFLELTNYRFFPGSLGNYAGYEREIPTYTIELLTADPAKAHFYWTALRFALVKALSFDIYDGEQENPFFTAQRMLRQAAYDEREEADVAQ